MPKKKAEPTPEPTPPIAPPEPELSACCSKPLRLISSSRSLGVPHHFVCPQCGRQYAVTRHPETKLATPDHERTLEAGAGS